MRPIEQRSRRALLRSGLLGSATLLAGCAESSGSTSDNSSPDEAASSPTGVFAGTSFEGQDLVVHLRDDHEVTQVNLIAPDGTAFAEKTVAKGATTVRIQILDIRLGKSGYEHYTPGKYELVGISGQSTEELDVPLEPELQLIGVRQYRSGSRSLDLSSVEVDIQNVGTGPTWVYDIAYRNPPNWREDEKLISDPGLPRIQSPNTPDELILQPKTEQSYVSTSTPLLLSDQDLQDCESEHQFEVIIGTAAGTTLEYPIQAVMAGNSEPTGLTGQYACSEVAVQLRDNGGS